MSSPPRLSYTEASWPALGAARFCLASIVFAAHLRNFVPANPLHQFIAECGGKAAIIGFFVISGLSMAHSYGQAKEGYFARRFLRIYPLYCAAVIFAQSLRWILPHPVADLAHASIAPAGFGTGVANLLFLQEFLVRTIPYDGPLWSLSMEVVFYLLTPLFHRCPRPGLLGLIALSMVGFRLGLDRYGVFAYLWPWLTGFLLMRDGIHPLSLILALFGVVLVGTNRFITHGFQNAATCGCIVGLILVAGKIVLPRLLERALRRLGELSYPLYLFHVPLCFAFFSIGVTRRAWVFVSLVLLCTVAFNAIFDQTLKNLFWKPLVLQVTAFFRARRTITP